MSGIVNKIKDALHHDSTTTGTHTTGTHTTGTHTTGTHTGTAEGVAGPHNSRVANAVDPRVDSDLDGSRNAGAATGTSGYGTGVTGTHTGTAEGVAGPHNSRVANAVDPRVDSDRDGSRNAGAATGTSGYGSGLTGTTGQSSHTTVGGTGPVHNSAILNKLDPRVHTDSNTHATSTHGDHSTGGYTGITGTSGGVSSSTNAGPHDSNIANKVDPRVDSDLDGRGNRVGANTGGVFGASGSHATAGSGTAQNTNGPHNSDMLNKLDPRIDSDGDHTRMAGGNRNDF